ncbi:hypothetical protein DIS24_g11280 [Lasiodiplodia hormozganensis]|uniref:Uncharacterized protein n=1 Tax=Lasiodiplodia hormozganensis TaxID=869390 RepID=A0AA39WVA4_9PEZI|nr:hypothetical protein DIS24_g11280 [Lasiodiplodia hormozganensis]
MTVGGSTRVAAQLSLDESYLTKSGLTCQARLAPDNNPLPPSLNASTSGAPYTGRVALSCVEPADTELASETIDYHQPRDAGALLDPTLVTDGLIC